MTDKQKTDARTFILLCGTALFVGMWLVTFFGSTPPLSAWPWPKIPKGAILGVEILLPIATRRSGWCFDLAVVTSSIGNVHTTRHIQRSGSARCQSNVICILSCLCSLYARRWSIII